MQGDDAKAGSGARTREWGKTEIRGGRHAFRIDLFARTFGRHVKGRARVLDAGCGDGSMTIRLIERGHELAAVDMAAGGIERLAMKLDAIFARDEKAAGDYPILARSSLLALPFPDESFDAVVSGEVLEHVPDHGAAADGFRRVLKPGGLCFVTAPANPALFDIEDEWAGHVRRYEKSELKALFEDRGFETVELFHWGWPVTYFYNRALYKNWLRLKLKKGDVNLEAAKSPGGSGVLMKLMYLGFTPDLLFTWLPFGIGLVGVFRKK